MPTREYCEGRFVDLNWDWLDALGGAVGAVAGGVLGNMVDGLPVIGGLGALGGGVGVGLSTLRSADLLFFDDFKAYPDGSSGEPNWTVEKGVWKTYRGPMWALHRQYMTYEGRLVTVKELADFSLKTELTIDKLPPVGNVWDAGIVVRHSYPDCLVLRAVWALPEVVQPQIQFLGIWRSPEGWEHILTSKPYEFKEKTPYTLEVDCAENLFVGYVNGVEVLRMVSDKVPRLGAIGLHATYLDVAFNKVKVYPGAIPIPTFGATRGEPGAPMRLGKYLITG